MEKYILPEIPFAYDALEPYIDSKTMEIHHTKHHQKYTDCMNDALEKLPQEFQNNDIIEILLNINNIPSPIKNILNFNGGGYDNHKLFWNNMKPNGDIEPGGTLADEITKSFGSFDEFKTYFSKNTVAIQGSGWGWLVFNPTLKKTEFRSMQNQTSPRTEGLVPLLGLDVWEHAYYLKYQNKRPDYISAWWNIINWDEVEKRLLAVK